MPPNAYMNLQIANVVFPSLGREKKSRSAIPVLSGTATSLSLAHCKYCECFLNINTILCKRYCFFVAVAVRGTGVVVVRCLSGGWSGD